MDRHLVTLKEVNNMKAIIGIAAVVCVALFGWCRTEQFSCDADQVVVESTIWAAVENSCSGNIRVAVDETVLLNGNITTVFPGQVLLLPQD
jgi:hypothetical protein